MARAEEVVIALSCRELALDAPIGLRAGGPTVPTSAGRVLLWHTLGERGPFDALNRTVTVSVRASLLERCADREGVHAAERLADALDRFGAAVASASAFSMCAGDLRGPARAGEVLEEVRARLLLNYRMRGELGWGELCWRDEDAVREAEAELDSELERTPVDHPVGALLSSGLVSLEEARRTTAFVGFVKPDRANYRDPIVVRSSAAGLAPAEWFATSRRARVPPVDEELGAQVADRLGEELLDALGEIRVTEGDCGSTASRALVAGADGLWIVATAGERALGRTAASALSASEGSRVVDAGELIDGATRDAIDRELLPVRIRSLLGCRATGGVCGACYGWDPATRRPVRVGDRVGMHAARSIGALARRLEERELYLPSYPDWRSRGGPPTARSGRVRWEITDAELVMAGSEAEHVALREGRVSIVDDEDNVLERFRVLPGDVFEAPDGAYVPRGTRVVRSVSGDDVVADIPQGASAIVRWVDVGGFVDTITCISHTDAAGLVLDVTRSDGTCSEQRLDFPRRGIAFVEDGAKVARGARLAHLRAEWGPVVIDVGLPALLATLGARGAPPRTHTEVAMHDGVVRRPDGEILEVHAGDGRVQRTRVNAEARCLAYDGERVRAGEPLTTGSPRQRDLLAAWGPERLAAHILDELVANFHASRARIAEAHLELAVWAMLGWARIGPRVVPRHLAEPGAAPLVMSIAAMARARRAARPRSP